MAKANPEDDLAHYALGQALVDAERHAEAVPVLRHVIKLNAGYSRAYVLLGVSQLATEDQGGAVATWQQGYGAAMARGDLMPANETKQRLSGLGEMVSMDVVMSIGEAEDDPDAGREPGPDEVRCVRTKRIGARMDVDPLGGEVGAFIKDKVSKESWADWFEMSIKVVNELRLDLGEPEGQRVWDEHMRDFLNIPASLFEDKTYE